MKKIYYLLILLPLAFMSSCNNDDDFPEVDLIITLDGVSQNPDTGVFYIINGEPAAITSLTASSLTDKDAVATNAIYSIYGIHDIPIFGALNSPQYGEIQTSLLQPGNYFLVARTTILQIDKSITNGVMSVPVTVVASEADLPAGLPEIGTYSYTVRMQPSDK